MSRQKYGVLHRVADFVGEHWEQVLLLVSILSTFWLADSDKLVEEGAFSALGITSMVAIIGAILVVLVSMASRLHKIEAVVVGRGASLEDVVHLGSQWPSDLLHGALSVTIVGRSLYETFAKYRHFLEELGAQSVPVTLVFADPYCASVLEQLERAYANRWSKEGHKCRVMGVIERFAEFCKRYPSITYRLKPYDIVYLGGVLVEKVNGRSIVGAEQYPNMSLPKNGANPVIWVLANKSPELFEFYATQLVQWRDASREIC